jgi:hypothetical protein
LNYPTSKKGAIVCAHIAAGTLGIARAVHDAPISNDDSGWQFLCGRFGSECIGEAEIWSLIEVLQLDPSLAPWIELIEGLDLKLSIEKEYGAKDWKEVGDS